MTAAERDPIKVGRREDAPEGSFTINIFARRHGDREKGENPSQAADVATNLNQRGRTQSSDAGKGYIFQAGRVRVSGSPRMRAPESAVRFVEAHNPEITDNDTYEEILEKIKYRPRVEEELDFFNKDNPASRPYIEASNQGRYLAYMAEEDNALKAAKGDRSSTAYGKHVYSIASLVGWNIKAAQRMARLNEHLEKQGKMLDDHFSHVKGNHGGVFEPFLAEIIRRTGGFRGDAERKRFIAAIPNGFANLAGPDIAIVASPRLRTKSLVHVSFTVGEGKNAFTYDKDVPLKVIAGILKDFTPPATPKAETAAAAEL